MERKEKYILSLTQSSIYLTWREAQCLAYTLRGHSNIKMAKSLNLSLRTIDFYITAIMKKLNCGSKSELLRKINQSDFKKSIESLVKEVDIE